jgi:hypothetical protein
MAAWLSKRRPPNAIKKGLSGRQLSRSGRAMNEHEFHAGKVSTLAYLVMSASGPGPTLMNEGSPASIRKR